MRVTCRVHHNHRVVLQPDRPALCKFWLESIVSGLSTSSGFDSTHVLTTLVAFLWLHTWAAVPEYLRMSLLIAVSVLVDKLGAISADCWRDDPLHDLMHRRFGCAEVLTFLRGVHKHAMALFWVLHGDPAFAAWRRENSMAMPAAFHRYEADQKEGPCAHPRTCVSAFLT